MAPVGNQGDGAPSRKFCRAAVRVLYNSTGSRYNKGAPWPIQRRPTARFANSMRSIRRTSRRCMRERASNPCEQTKRAMASTKTFAWQAALAGSPAAMCIRKIPAGQLEKWSNAVRLLCLDRAIDRMGEEPRPCRTSRRGRIAVARGDFLAAADASSFESALRERPCRREDDCATPARACWDGAIFGARHREGRACDVI